jgi:hypothetical protein
MNFFKNLFPNLDNLNDQSGEVFSPADEQVFREMLEDKGLVLNIVVFGVIGFESIFTFQKQIFNSVYPDLELSKNEIRYNYFSILYNILEGAGLEYTSEHLYSSSNSFNPEDIQSSLNELIEVFTQTEEYEKCNTILTIKKNINEVAKNS